MVEEQGSFCVSLKSINKQQKKESFPPLPEKIPLIDLLSGKKEAKELLCSSFANYRFAVLKCDEETKRLISEYKEAGLQFFSLDQSVKDAYAGKSDKPDQEKILQRKVNKGYLFLPNVKEFLKVLYNLKMHLH